VLLGEKHAGAKLRECEGHRYALCSRNAHSSE